MAEPRYPFSRQFQEHLVTLLLTPPDGPRLLAENLVRPEWFEDPTLATIVATITNLHREIGEPPTWDLVQESLRLSANGDRRAFEAMIERLRQPIQPSYGRFLAREVVRFARHQAFRHAIRTSVSLLQADQQDEIETVWRQAFAVGRGIGGEGTWLIKDLAERMSARLVDPDVLVSLIPELDRQLDEGGFARSELVAWLGGPGTGKSFALVHMAKASLIQRKRVIFYTLEMSARKVADRLDANLAGVPIQEIRMRADEITKALQAAHQQYGDLLIKEFPAGATSVSQLRAHAAMMRNKGFPAEVVIVDYINLLQPIAPTGRAYEDLGQVYIELRGWAMEEKLWMFTAAQGNRYGPGQERGVLTLEDMADSYKGAMHADIVISINQTQEEHQRQYLRLFITKNRHGPGRVVIGIYTNFAKGSFYRRIVKEEEPQ